MPCGRKHSWKGERSLGASWNPHAGLAVIFENLEAGANIDDIMEWFQGLDRNQINAVIEFAARSLDETPSSALTR